jgi:hypothetical protein
MIFRRKSKAALKKTNKEITIIKTRWLLSKFWNKAVGQNAYKFLTKIVRDLRCAPFEREDWGTCSYGESKVFLGIIHVENSF